MKKESTFRGPTVAARNGEHRGEQCGSSGGVIWKHRFHTAAHLHRRSFPINTQSLVQTYIKTNSFFIRSFISEIEFVYFYMYLKMRCAREFCFGMRNGELAGLALAPTPAVSLDAVAVRAAVDRRTDLAAVAAAEDMTLGWAGTMTR